MKRKLCAATLTIFLLTGTCAGAWYDSVSIHMSLWAVSEVQAAYDNGVISSAFDLGTDYTRPITRSKLARLTADLILHEQQFRLSI